MKCRFICMLTVLMLSSCATSNTYKGIGADEFKDYGTDPLYHTIYIGSDDTYHYFAWSKGLRQGKWKVNKATMPFTYEFKLEANRRSFITMDDFGNYQPMVLQETTP